VDIQHTVINVADYCAMQDRHELTVNKAYQRSEKVWPRPAQTFLIETILLGFPIPKLSLHQKTDVQERRSVKDVVDGQQRTKAITDFFHDKYRLGRNLDSVPEAAGKTFSELSEELQHQFLAYPLNFDLFVLATEAEVREVFRRMNSFTVPLNPEEQRHAVYQGPFKWFVRRLAADYDTTLIAAGVFSPNQVVRMQDTKLLTEIATAFFKGITTTKKADLDRTYKERDRGEHFDGEEDLDRRMRAGFDRVLGWEDLFGTTLLKRSHVVYSVVLAVMHLQESVPTLEEHFDASGRALADDDEIIVNLSRLSDALDNDNRDGPDRDFVLAASEKTNVAGQRIGRFKALCEAMAADG
jgi:hypothetical protein